MAALVEEASKEVCDDSPQPPRPAVPTVSSLSPLTTRHPSLPSPLPSLPYPPPPPTHPHTTHTQTRQVVSTVRHDALCEGVLLKARRALPPRHRRPRRLPPAALATPRGALGDVPPPRPTCSFGRCPRRCCATSRKAVAPPRPVRRRRRRRLTPPPVQQQRRAAKGALWQIGRTRAPPVNNDSFVPRPRTLRVEGGRR